MMGHPLARDLTPCTAIDPAIVQLELERKPQIPHLMRVSLMIGSKFDNE
jgi:hypothetical protein